MNTHIATSEDLGRIVRRGLHEPASFVADNLLVGPCAAAAQTHVQARCNYWGLRGRERARFLGSFRETLEALDTDGRLVVWTSERWADTEALWAFCAWRLLSRPTDPNIHLVVLGGPLGDEANGLGQHIHVRPGNAKHGLEGARSLSLARAREMAVSWRKLCRASPILAETSNRQTPTRRAFSALGSYQAVFFPRLDDRGPVLSRFDELVFSCVGEQWATPLDVFMRRGEAGDELRKWVSLTGDVFLAARLAQWASHGGADAALDSEPYQPENFMKAARYRLSDAGRAAQRQGLTRLDQGAPLVIWGATAYDPLAPWVVVDGRGGKGMSKLAS